MWNDLSMSEKAQLIQLGVSQGITDLGTIRDTYNQYAHGGKVNRFDEGGSNRIEYIDKVTGKTFDHKPTGYIEWKDGMQLKDDVETTYENKILERQSEQYPVQLDELAVYLNGAGPLYNNNVDPTMTEQNMFHRAEVAANDARVRESAAFEKPMNFLSPGQWFGAGIDYLQGETDDFFGSIYHGNSGWVPDNFARENPRASALINFAGDIAIPYATGKVGGSTFNSLYPKTKGLVKAYHGSPVDFPLEEAIMGTRNDIGLHMGVGKQGRVIAKSMAGENGVVKEAWVPKPQMETIDLGANGIDLLTNDIKFRKGVEYDIAGNNSFRRNLLERQGAEVTEGSKMTIDKDVTVPLLDETWPDIPPEARLEIQELIDEYNSKGLNPSKNPYKLDYTPAEEAAMADINKRAADILSKHGKKVIEYNNNNAYEGGGGASLIITDPSVFQYPTQLNTNVEYIGPLIWNRKTSGGKRKKK